MSEELTPPRGWMRATLGDVLHIVRGVTYDKLESAKEAGDGRIPILRATNIGKRLDFDDLVYVPSKCVSEEQMLRRGDIVIAASSGSISVVGKAARLTDEWHGSFGAFCMGLRVNPAIDSAYVAYFLGTSEYRRGVSQLAAGSNINNLRRTHIESFSFPIAPLPEQSRIVAKIEELFSDLDAGVAALQRVTANLKRYRAAVLKAAVEGRLTEEWRTRHPATEPAAKLLERILAERRAKWEQDQLRKFKEAGKTPPKGWKEKYETPLASSADDGGAIPQTWCVTTIDQLSHFVTSGSRGWAEHYSEDGPLFIRAQDINSDRLRLDRVAHVQPPAGAEVARTRTAVGDLLVTVTGANVTKTGFVEQELGDAYVSQHVAMVRLVLPSGVRYVHTWVVCPTHGRRTLEKLAYGAGKPGLNLEQVRSLSVWLPPLVEQADIVAEVDRRLSVADAAETQVEHALQRAARLRQAILKRAFEGNLVPQDPTDEPAETLLERLNGAPKTEAPPSKSLKRIRVRNDRSKPTRRSAGRQV